MRDAIKSMTWTCYSRAYTIKMVLTRKEELGPFHGNGL